MTPWHWVALAFAGIVAYQISSASGGATRRVERIEKEARQWAEKSMSQTQLCLAGEPTEMYDLTDCRAEWTMAQRIAFYRKVLQDGAPSIYD